MATWPDLVTAVPTVSFWLPTRLIWKDQESFLLKVKHSGSDYSLRDNFKSAPSDRDIQMGEGVVGGHLAN